MLLMEIFYGGAVLILQCWREQGFFYGCDFSG
jgi:hypothetical protein